MSVSRVFASCVSIFCICETCVCKLCVCDYFSRRLELKRLVSIVDHYRLWIIHTGIQRHSLYIYSRARGCMHRFFSRWIPHFPVQKIPERGAFPLSMLYFYSPEQRERVADATDFGCVHFALARHRSCFGALERTVFVDSNQERAPPDKKKKERKEWPAGNSRGNNTSAKISPVP